MVAAVENNSKNTAADCDYHDAGGDGEYRLIADCKVAMTAPFQWLEEG